MKILITTGLLIAVLTVPGLSSAQGKPMTRDMDCPNAEQMGEIHEQMRDMMHDMEGMMEHMPDPAGKERMQQMHDQMADMMARMQKMRGGMGGMPGDHMKGRQHMMQGDGGD